MCAQAPAGRIRTMDTDGAAVRSPRDGRRAGCASRPRSAARFELRPDGCRGGDRTMNDGIKDGYRRLRRGVTGVALGATVTLAGVLGAFADEYGEYGEAQKYAAGGGYEEYEYAAGPAYVYYEDAVYSYATSAEGDAHYYVYDGEWSEPVVLDSQPVQYKWEPAVVEYNDQQYTFYTGEDGKYYHNAYDGTEWSGWEDISGEYEFVEAPYANEYDDYVYVYGAATDGYVYYKTWGADGWSEWAAVNDAYPR